MRGLLYQLKSVRKDKFCIMSFLLPVVVAVVLHFSGSIDLSSLGELQFGVCADDTAPEAENWLARYGSVTVFQTKAELIRAIREPSTNLIGVTMEGEGIRTILSGDEWAIIWQAASTLPQLYEMREIAAEADVQLLERPDILAGYQNIFAAMTLVVAMFMGCIFNAVNIISEKEDGVAFINEILPMSFKTYVLQKIFIGFAFGCLSAVVTGTICFRLSAAGAGAMLALIILSALAAAVIGLFIGHISDGLMMGVVYIKIVMLIFMAVPLLKYLAVTDNKVLSFLCYLIPSSAAFEGIMNLVNGSAQAIGKDMAILMAHCAGWLLLYQIFNSSGSRCDI